MIQRIGIVYLAVFWIGFPAILLAVGQSWSDREKTYWGLLYCCIALVIGYLLSLIVKRIDRK